MQPFGYCANNVCVDEWRERQSRWLVPTASCRRPTMTSSNDNATTTTRLLQLHWVTWPKWTSSSYWRDDSASRHPLTVPPHWNVDAWRPALAPRLMFTSISLPCCLSLSVYFSLLFYPLPSLTSRFRSLLVVFCCPLNSYKLIKPKNSPSWHSCITDVLLYHHQQLLR